MTTKTMARRQNRKGRLAGGQSASALAAAREKLTAGTVDTAAAERLESGEPVAAAVELAAHLTMSYLDYARETIMDRAVPDARDGLKPSQRRILYVMHELGLRSNQPPKKCARIVGDTLGRYHPHGDTAVYDALVRMAQSFLLRVPLIDGQGNFGDGDDRAAAYRYTEARLTAAAEAMLREIDMDTVDFAPNFDNTMQEPVVLPGAFPNLLVNGTLGVACGVATSMPPHNVGEVCRAAAYMAQHWSRRGEITVDELLEFIPGPDFPTGGVVFRYVGEGEDRRDSVRQMYDRGKGSIVVQAQVDIESRGGGKSQIVITEMPYGVRKGWLMKKIALAVQAGRVTGITDLRDESDHTGTRIVVEVSRQADAADVIRQLFRQGLLKRTFIVRNLALVRGEDGVMRPQYLSLRDLLVQFIAHRLDVIVRRTRYELERRRARLHIVEGLLKALDTLNEVVETIRKSRSPDTARQNLMRRWAFTDVQAQAILDMPLRRLTALERSKLQEEAREVRSRIEYLTGLLASEEERLLVVISETNALSEQFSTPRRTVIVGREDAGAGAVITKTDLVAPDRPQTLLLTAAGLQRLDHEAAPSRRPARGLSRQAVEPDEVHLQCLLVEPKAEVLLLSDRGRAWRGQVGFLPRVATPTELGLSEDERLVGLAALPEEVGERYLVLGTLSGKVKRTRVADLRLLDRQWGTVIGLAEGDRLLFGGVVGPGAHVVFYSAQGQVLRMDADKVNPQQTDTARGMAGVALREGDRLLGGAVIPDAAQDAGLWWVVVVSQRGYAHRAALAEFPIQGRGASGVRCLRPSRGGGAVAAIAVGTGTVVDVYLGNGRRLRLSREDIPATARDALGSQVVQVGDVGVRSLVLLPER